MMRAGPWRSELESKISSGAPRPPQTAPPPRDPAPQRGPVGRRGVSHLTDRAVLSEEPEQRQDLVEVGDGPLVGEADERAQPHRIGETIHAGYGADLSHRGLPG